MEVNGYLFLNDNANLKHCMGEKSDWLNKSVRVMEFNDQSKSVLMIDNTATKMGMVDYSDIKTMFKCREVNGILVPHFEGIYSMFHSEEVFKRMFRKGGYNEIVKKMVIAASLHRGEFNDDFLFQKQ